MQTTTVIRRTHEGWQRRTRLDFNKLMAMEHAVAGVTRTPTGINIVQEYWRSQMSAGVVHFEDFNPVRDLGDLADLGVTVCHVDVRGENPWHYRFTSFKGLYFGWMGGRCLADFPLPPVVDDCAVEYFECKSAGQPVAHHIQHNINGFSRDYLRLLLPLAGGDGSPTALVSVGRHLVIQDPGESSPATRPG